MTHEYLIVYEEGDGTWSAYSPDVPGVVAAADTREEIEVLMKEAIEFHIEGLREFGEPIPVPSQRNGTVRIDA